MVMLSILPQHLYDRLVEWCGLYKAGECTLPCMHARKYSIDVFKNLPQIPLIKVKN